MKKRLGVLLALLVPGVLLALWAVREQQDRRVGGLPWRVHLDRAAFVEDLSSQQIEHTVLSLRILPERDALEGRARLSMRSTTRPQSALRLFLDPGLRIDAVVCNGAAAETTRNLECLVLRPAERSGKYEVDIKYSGPLSMLAAPSSVVQDCVVLASDACWYPRDLQSFSMLEGQIELPASLEVVVPGLIITKTVEGAIQRVEWKSERPQAGATIVAGQFQRREMSYGALTCRLYAANMPANAENLLRMGGTVQSYYETLLGTAQVSVLNLVEAPGLPALAAEGGVVSLPVPAEDLTDPVPWLARALARNWFPGRAGGHWFDPAPAAGVWTAEGLPLYLYWCALESFRGREALQRELKSRAVTPPGTPLRPVDVWAYHQLPGTQRENLRPFMGWQARMLESVTSRQAMLQTCRSLLHTHPGEAISLEMFQKELELVSEKDLSELSRQWFDLRVIFDYEIAAVETAAGKTRVRLGNLGSVPSPVPLSIAVRTQAGVRNVQAPVGDRGGLISVEGEALEIVLDPDFLLPDMQRENNVWPRQGAPTTSAG